MTENKPLSDSEIERYARHIVLPEIGGSGQQKLKTARVCVVGAGGLGSPVLIYLAAAGVGTLGIIDDDVVTLSNLQRQTIHETGDVGTAKVLSAADYLKRVNPEVRTILHETRVNAHNVDEILEGYDIIVDGTDNFESRYLIADAAEKLALPLVTAALGRFDGSLTVLAPHENSNPRFRDLFPEPPPENSVPTCAQAGVLGATAGVVGTLQATEVIKLITGIGRPLIGEMLLYDALETRLEKVRYKRQA